jgi:hypothetical protein
LFGKRVERRRAGIMMTVASGIGLTIIAKSAKPARARTRATRARHLLGQTAALPRALGQIAALPEAASRGDTVAGVRSTPGIDP